MVIDIKEKENRVNSHKKRVNLIFKDHDIDKMIEKVLKTDSEKIIDEIKDSGLRGRGGAGFPTWIKFKSAKEAKSDIKYVCLLYTSRCV